MEYISNSCIDPNNLSITHKLEKVRISETISNGRMGVKKRSRLDSQPRLSRKKSFNSSTDSFSDKSNFGSSGPNSNTGIFNSFLNSLSLKYVFNSLKFDLCGLSF